MPLYTVFSEIGAREGYSHLTQHEVASPAHAVSDHLGQLPTDISDDDFAEFVGSYLDPKRVRLHLCHRNVWVWLDAAQNAPRINTYVIETV